MRAGSLACSRPELAAQQALQQARVYFDQACENLNRRLLWAIKVQKSSTAACVQALWHWPLHHSNLDKASYTAKLATIIIPQNCQIKSEPDTTLLPDLVTKILQCWYSPHFQVHERRLCHLQLPANAQPVAQLSAIVKMLSAWSAWRSRESKALSNKHTLSSARAAAL